MKPVLTAFAAAALAFLAAPTAEAMPLSATHSNAIAPAPITQPAIGSASLEGLVHKVGDRHVYRRGLYIHRGIRYYNGHRGIRYARHGYRHYKGYWYPRQAFSVTINIGPRVVHRRHRGAKIIHVNSQHVAWCHGRYKTYRASDNTYAYKVGKRTYCRSPYSR